MTRLPRFPKNGWDWRGWGLIDCDQWIFEEIPATRGIERYLLIGLTDTTNWRFLTKGVAVD